jgi:predicted glutamine amidotransferase
MCRFLMAAFAEPEDPGGLLARFADMCRESRSPDGDRQADGWGAAWFDESAGWTVRKSLRPIWRDDCLLETIPRAKILAVHARSASFLRHRDNLAFNQPFFEGPAAFVFNGFLRGVRLPRPVPGGIGSQKIWALLRGLLESHPPETAVRRLDSLLEASSREIQALNLGLCTPDRLIVLNRAAHPSPYYRLHASRSRGPVLVASEPLADIDFQPLPPGKVISIPIPPRAGPELRPR